MFARRSCTCTPDNPQPLPGSDLVSPTLSCICRPPLFHHRIICMLLTDAVNLERHNEDKYIGFTILLGQSESDLSFHSNHRARQIRDRPLLSAMMHVFFV
jgi:hypothetical protein